MTVKGNQPTLQKPVFEKVAPLALGNRMTSWKTVPVAD
jgi:hypothetical protein